MVLVNCGSDGSVVNFRHSGHRDLEGTVKAEGVNK